jgi:hypothetical protein
VPPNVRAKWAPTVGRQAREDDDRQKAASRAWWPAVGAPLERGVSPPLVMRRRRRTVTSSVSPAATPALRAEADTPCLGSSNLNWSAIESLNAARSARAPSSYSVVRLFDSIRTPCGRPRRADCAIGTNMKTPPRTERDVNSKLCCGSARRAFAWANVRAKLAPTALRAGQQAHNGAKPQRLMASVPRRWCSA